MSVDWNSAPDGAVAHVHCRGEYNAGSGPVRHESFARWVDKDGRFGLDDQKTNAPTFGTKQSTITIRPSAAEDELWARTSRLEETCAGQQIRISDLGGYLSDAEKDRDQLRAEVDRVRAHVRKLDSLIEEVGGCTFSCINTYEDLKRSLTGLKGQRDKFEAERDQLQAELERVQTSRSAEGDRLDWLLQNLPGSVLRELVGELGCTSDVAEWRAAIDRAAGFTQNNTLSIEPIHGTSDALAKLTIRGGGNG